MRILEIQTPPAIIDLLCNQSEDAPDTFSALNIAEIIQHIRGLTGNQEIQYYPLDHQQLEDAIWIEEDETDDEDPGINQQFHLTDDDLDDECRFIDDDKKEVYLLLIDVFIKVQKAICEELRNQGHIVHSSAPIYQEPLDIDTLPESWHPQRENPNCAIKVIQKDRIPIKQTFITPCHPHLSNERFYPYVKADGKEGTIVFAPNYTDSENVDDSKAPLTHRLAALAKAMEACSFLHSIGKLHRDIKLENIIIINTPKGIIIKLCDNEFVSRHNEPTEKMMSTSEYTDLEWYPYQESIHKISAKEMDVFAFGLVLLVVHIENEGRKQFMDNLMTEFTKSFTMARQNFDTSQISLTEDEVINEDLARESILRQIQEKRLVEFDSQEFITSFMQEFYPEIPVSPMLLQSIGQMFSYYRQERPNLDEVIKIMKIAYPEIEAEEFADTET